MKPKLIRVHENFKKILDRTLKELNKHTKPNMSMIDLTEILAGDPNGSNLISLRMPIIVIPARKKPGRNKPIKPLFERYVNIVLEDEPR